MRSRYLVHRSRFRLERFCDNAMLERIAEVGNRSWAWFRERAGGKHAFGWLVALSFFEPIVSPIVPETLLVAILIAHPERWIRYALVTALASIAGGVAGYFIGLFFFDTIGSQLVALYGLEQMFQEAKRLMAAHIFITMFLVSFSPLPDKVFVLAAGFLAVSFPLYFLGYAIGRTIRFFLVAYLVQRFGIGIIHTVNRYFSIVAIIAFLILLFIVLEFLNITNVF